MKKCNKKKDVCNLRDAHLIRAAGSLPAYSLVQDSLAPGQAFWARPRGLRNPPFALCCFPVPQARGAFAEGRPRLWGMSLLVFACRLGLGILLWAVAELLFPVVGPPGQRRQESEEPGFAVGQRLASMLEPCTCSGVKTRCVHVACGSKPMLSTSSKLLSRNKTDPPSPRPHTHTHRLADLKALLRVLNRSLEGCDPS